MKKRMAAMLMVVTILMLTACGSKLADSKYLGTWEGTTAKYEDMDMSVADLYGTFNIILKEDGTATVETQEANTAGKWEETDNGIKIDGVMELVEDDGNLTYAQDGMTIVFELKK